jgi:hypothetical protein
MISKGIFKFLKILPLFQMLFLWLNKSSSEEVLESRLEGGGVNRANLKFTNLSTPYKPGLALEI